MENANYEVKDILVKHLDITESLSQKGFLKYLKRVKPDNFYEGTRVYYFDNLPEVRKAIDEAYAEHNANTRGGSHAAGGQ